MCAVKNLLRTFRRVLGTSSRNYFLRRRTQKTQQGADVLEGEGEQSASSEGGLRVPQRLARDGACLVAETSTRQRRRLLPPAAAQGCALSGWRYRQCQQQQRHLLAHASVMPKGPKER